MVRLNINTDPFDSYPDDWPTIAARIKAKANHRCEKCGVTDSHNPADGNCLTVHHLVPTKQLCEDWNLAALCQRCHLILQGTDLNVDFDLHQTFFSFFEVPAWFKPHLDGFLQWRKQCGL
jgi:hypothetical protein